MIQMSLAPSPACRRTKPAAGPVAIRAVLGTTPRTREWITPARSPLHRQRDAQLPTRPVVGAQKDVIGEVERDGCLSRSVPLELLLQEIGVVTLVGQATIAQHGDDGAPGLPRQRDRVHAT